MTLHNEQEAIKQAVEAGWKPTLYSKWRLRKNIEVEDGYLILYDRVSVLRFPLDSVFSDPAFWQALGKVRGWGWQKRREKLKIPRSRKTLTLETERSSVEAEKEWLYHALRYFEVKLSGGDLSEFWQTLP